MCKWKGWVFYDQCNIPEEFVSIIKGNSITELLSENFSKTIRVYISRQDRGIDVSFCIQIMNSLIIWVYWNRSQGILKHSLSLQYKTLDGEFIHLANLVDFTCWSYIISNIFTVLPGYKPVDNSYTSLYKFIITENIPIEWKKIRGFLDGLRRESSNNGDTIYPTIIDLELYQSGNFRKYRGEKLLKTYFYGY
jgi:hypothetical protein